MNPSSATATASGDNVDATPADNSKAAPVAVNRPPVATADSASLPSSDSRVDVDVLANDSDPDADPITVTAVTGGTHGTPTIVGGKVRYTVTDRAFVGTDTFTYTVCDNRSGCTTQSGVVTVADHSVADLAVTESASPAFVQRDGGRTATWTAVVTNIGPSAELAPKLTQTFPTGVTVGQVSGATCTASATVYTCPLAALDAGDSATVTFTVTLPATAPDPTSASGAVTGTGTDPVTGNNTATAAVGVNTPPVAAGDSATLSSTATTATVDVLGNDTDPDGDTLTVTTVVSGPSHGKAVVGDDGKVRYTPTAGYVGSDTFTYRVCDPAGDCDTATVAVKVASAPPVARTDTGTVRPGDSVVVDVLQNDSDPDGGTLGDVTIVKQPKYGKAFVDKNGKLHYTAPDGGVPGGSVTIGYRTCTSAGVCTTGNVRLAVTDSGSSGTGSTGDGADEDTSGGGLAFTGAEIGSTAGLALILMLAGGFSVIAARRRRHAPLMWRYYDEHGHHRTTDIPPL